LAHDGSIDGDAFMQIEQPSALVIPVILAASLILERLATSLVLRAGIKRGTIRDARDPRPALLTKLGFLQLTLVIFAGWLALGVGGQADIPAAVSDDPDQLLDLQRAQRSALTDLQVLLVMVLIYLGLQLLGIGNRFLRLCTPIPSAPHPGA
jgi:hypothetical protein